MKDLPDILEHEKSYDCEFNFDVFLLDPNYINYQVNGNNNLLKDPYKVRV